MAKHRAIPHGFMTVGEAAKKLGVTVRTLQYYDKEGCYLLRQRAKADAGFIQIKIWLCFIKLYL